MHLVFGSGESMEDFAYAFGYGIGVGFACYVLLSLLGMAIYKALAFFK